MQTTSMLLGTFAMLTMLTTAAGCGYLRQQHGTESAAANPTPTEKPYSAPEFDETRADLDAAIAQASDGYTEGAVLAGKLEAFAPIELPVARGTCYVGAFVLDDGAAFGEHARKGVSVKSRFPEELPTSHAGVVHGPGAVFDMGCPENTGTGSVDLIANFGSATDDSRIHELGSGGYALHIYEQPISEADLVARIERRKAMFEQQAREQQTFRERQAEERERRDREEAERRQPAESDAKGRASASGGPAQVSVTLINRCSRSVKVFFGKIPKFGSGTQSTLGGNSRQNHSFREGETMWLLDDAGNGVSSVTASPGMREIEVTSACTGTTSR